MILIWCAHPGTPSGAVRGSKCLASTPIWPKRPSKWRSIPTESVQVFSTRFASMVILLWCGHPSTPNGAVRGSKCLAPTPIWPKRPSKWRIIPRESVQVFSSRFASMVILRWCGHPSTPNGPVRGSKFSTDSDLAETAVQVEEHSYGVRTSVLVAFRVDGDPSLVWSS